MNVAILSKPVQSKKGYRDVSNDVITNEIIEGATLLVQNTDNYGLENELITRCLTKFPLNIDSCLDSMKMQSTFSLLQCKNSI